MNSPRFKVLLVVALIAALTASCNLKIKMPTLGHVAQQAATSTTQDSAR